MNTPYTITLKEARAAEMIGRAYMKLYLRETEQ